MNDDIDAKFEELLNTGRRAVINASYDLKIACEDMISACQTDFVPMRRHRLGRSATFMIGVVGGLLLSIACPSVYASVELAVQTATTTASEQAQQMELALENRMTTFEQEFADR